MYYIFNSYFIKIRGIYTLYKLYNAYILNTELYNLLNLK